MKPEKKDYCDYDIRTIPVVICKRYSVTPKIKSIWRSQSIRSDEFNLLTRYPWFGSFLVTSKHMLKKSQQQT